MVKCVFCEAMYHKSAGKVSFYQFPKDEILLKQWLRNMGYDLNWRPKKNQLLCSQHFTNECFKGKYRKKDSIPTIFEKNPNPYIGLQIKNEFVEKNPSKPITTKDNSNNISVNSIQCEVKREIIDSDSEEVDASQKKAIKYQDGDISDENSVNVPVKCKQSNINYQEIYIKCEKETISGPSDVNVTTKRLVITSDTTDEKYNIKTEKVKNGMEKGKILDGVVNDSDKANQTGYTNSGIVHNNPNLTFLKAKVLDNLYICDICHKQFKVKRSKDRHIRIKHTKNYIVYKCEFCTFTSYCKRNLKCHVNSRHTKTITYNCSYCSHSTTNKFHLAIHINSQHTKSNIFSCTQCTFTSYSKSNLAVHIKTKHSTRTALNCPHCHFKTYQKCILDIHINARHTKSILYYCPHCDFKAYRKGDVATHVKSTIHTKITSYTCTFCSFKSCNRNQYEVKREVLDIGYEELDVNQKVAIKQEPDMHDEEVNVNSYKVAINYEQPELSDNEIYIKIEREDLSDTTDDNINNKLTTNEVETNKNCKIRTKKVKRDNNREEIFVEVVHETDNAHQTSYTNSSTVNSDPNLLPVETKVLENLYICDICHKRFKGKQGIDKHIRIKHTKNYTVFKCEFCTFTTYCKSSLKCHVNAKHTKSKTYDCPHCSYTSYYKVCLTEHISMEHTKSIFNCDYCSFKSYSRNKFKKHVDTIHLKKKTYNCSYCSHSSTNKFHLATHVNSQHTKSVIFSCTQCTFTSYSKSNLADHVKAKHTNRTALNCPHCSFTTYQKCHLDIHINARHTKNTLYYCPHCDFKSYRRGDVSTHVKYTIHTKVTSYTCTFCSFKSCNRWEIYGHIKDKHS